MNRPEFADELIALGQHLQLNPDLPTIYAVLGSRVDPVCNVRLLVGEGHEGAARLAAWAATMSEVESHAYRFHEDSVDGHVIGWIGGRKFDVHGSLGSEAFPEEDGRHVWDVTTLLQEA